MRHSNNHERRLVEPVRQDTLQKELTSLAVKIIIIIAGSWSALYIFEIFAAPIIGLKHPQFQTAGTVITITIAITTIITIRRILRKFSHKIHPQASASISFFIILFISLIASISVLYRWDVNPQEILVGGGVAAIIVGIGVSTIVGNIFSGGLMLTTFPAKIGDSIFIVNDNIRGRIEEITMMYTKVMTDQGTEYVVPNNAIIQGNVRLTKDISVTKELPFTEGERIELKDSSNIYAGTVIKITSSFSTILSDDKKKETTIANGTILNGNFIIIKDRME